MVPTPSNFGAAGCAWSIIWVGFNSKKGRGRGGGRVGGRERERDSCIRISYALAFSCWMFFFGPMLIWGREEEGRGKGKGKKWMQLKAKQFKV